MKRSIEIETIVLAIPLSLATEPAGQIVSIAPEGESVTLYPAWVGIWQQVEWQGVAWWGRNPKEVCVLDIPVHAFSSGNTDIPYVRLSEIPDGFAKGLSGWIVGQARPMVPGLEPQDAIFEWDWERYLKERRKS